MPIVTASAVTIFSAISASAATITTSGLISIVQERINFITNNYFLTDLDLQDVLTFNATARTVVAANSFAARNFLAGDEVFIYYSHRNDGYYTVLSVSDKTLTLATGSTVIDELSGRTIITSVVKWPTELQYVAAQMVYYDYDIRATRSAGVKSRSLGPWSESYGDNGGSFGYPKEIISPLNDYRIVKLV